MNNQFKEYVTDKSFSLSLSKGQIKTLYWLIINDRESMIHDSRSVSYLQGLERKGLVYHDRRLANLSIQAYIARGESAWKVTKAGALVYQLLIEAGMVKEKQKTDVAA